jgi:hypothetical protein
MYKVPAPALGRTGRYGRGATMQGDVLPSPHTHPELQILESIESSHPLAIHQPAFATQEHPKAKIANAGPSMSQIANAHA